MLLRDLPSSRISVDRTFGQQQQHATNQTKVWAVEKANDHNRHNPKQPLLHPAASATTPDTDTYVYT